MSCTSANRRGRPGAWRGAPRTEQRPPIGCRPWRRGAQTGEPVKAEWTEQMAVCRSGRPTIGEPAELGKAARLACQTGRASAAADGDGTITRCRVGLHAQPAMRSAVCPNAHPTARPPYPQTHGPSCNARPAPAPRGQPRVHSRMRSEHAWQPQEASPDWRGPWGYRTPYARCRRLTCAAPGPAERMHAVNAQSTKWHA
jgi:hypothetical protein